MENDENGLVPAPITAADMQITVPKRTDVMGISTAPLKLKKVIENNFEKVQEHMKKLKGRSNTQRFRMMRNYAYARMKGKDYKLNRPEKSNALHQMGMNIGGIKKDVAAAWGAAAQAHDDRELAEVAWKTFLESKTASVQAADGSGTYQFDNNLVRQAFGRDAIGEAKRKNLEDQGFMRTGGGGKFKPYYVAGGILRGGFTGKGRDHGNAFMIPIKPRNEKRILQSVLAKYTNPTSWPATRVVKYVRGHWGQSNAKGDNDLLYF